ncbi:MAG: autotransporter domain-containing protein [Betaproteobacteria bacterium]|nr:autotransporter domain-containing protein [Betaproteobacteria bacterium]
MGGVNTYTGSTAISDGTLALAGNGSIASSAIINNEANFDISQIGPSFAIIKNINGSGGIQLGAKQLVISNADGLISGVIADGGLGGGTGGSLVKLGTATLELSGQNKFTGSTTINQGTLLLTGSVAGNTIVGSGATLVSNGSIGGNLSNLGTVTVGLDHGQGKGAGSLLTVSGSYAQGQAAIINYDIAGQTTDQLIVGKQIPAGGLQGEVHVAGTPLPGTTYVLIQGPVGSTGPAGVTSSNYKLAFDSYVIAKGTHIEYETDGNPATMDFKVVNDPVPIVNNTPLNNNSCVGAFCNAAVQAPGGSKGTASVAKVFDKSSNLINLVAGSVAQPLPPSAPSNPSPNPLPTPSAKPPVIIPAVSGGTTGISVENAVKALAPQAAAAGIGISSTSSTSSSASTPAGSAVFLDSVNIKANQKLVAQAAAAIDHVQVQTELLRQPNSITYNNALRNLEGQPFGTWQSVMLESMARLRENAIELAASGKRFSTTEEIVSCGSGPWERGTADQAQSSSSGCTTKLAQRFLPWSMFADASATTATLQGSNNLASTDYSIGQSLYGIEYSPSTNWRAGAAFGYGQNALYGYQYANVLIANTAYSGVGWLTWLPGNFRVTGLYGYSTFDNNSNRNIRIGDAIDRTAVGNWKSSGNTVALEASYNWIINPNASASGDVAGMTYGKPGFTGVGPITIKPIASISYSNHVQPGFAESGANSLDLALQNHTAESWLSTLGVELKAPIVLSRNTAIVPRVMARWKHDFNGNANEERDINASYANLPSLGNQLIVGQNRGEDALQLVGGLEFEASNSSLYANVGYGSWSNGTELTWSGGMRYRW